MKKIIITVLAVFFLSNSLLNAQGVWTEKAPMDSAFSMVRAEAYNGKIYVLLGDNGITLNWRLREYDISSDSWNNFKSQLPSPGLNNPVGLVNDSLFVFQPGGPAFFYDIGEETWTYMATNAPNEIGYAGFTVLNDKIYLINGTYGGASQSTCYEYDLISDTYTSKDAVPTAKHRSSAESVNGKIYVFGGWDNSYNYFDAIEEFDPTQPSGSQWSTKSSTMFKARGGMASGVVNGKIYLIAGHSQEGSLNIAEEYDPITDSITLRSPCIYKRFDVGSTIYNNKIYVIGGFDGVYFNQLEEYDPFASPADTLSIVSDGYGDYVYVPAGEFQMGDNFNEGEAEELPVHTVYLDAYYIGKYEVTNAQYAAFLNEEGNQSEGGESWLDINDPDCRIEYTGGQYQPKTGYSDHPVVEVNWYGARAYCTWLTAKTEYTYRLPTEAEWEKAARGTDQRRYPWGNTIDSSYANYNNSGDPYESEAVESTPVGYYDGSTYGSFSTSDNSSPYGAYDMAGNVWEWCHDWYGSNYYSVSPVNNPQGPASGTNRVVRSGGMNGDNAEGLRAAYRGAGSPTYTHFPFGFRAVREVGEASTSLIDSLEIFFNNNLLIGPGQFPGDTISVPVYLDTVNYSSHNGIYSFQYELLYNDSLFECLGYDSSGTVLGNYGGLSPFTVEFRTDSGSAGGLDTLRFAAASDDSLYYPNAPGTPFEFSRVLTNLKFRINPAISRGDSTPLIFSSAMLNEGTPAVSTNNGSLTMCVRLLGDVDYDLQILPYDAVLVLRTVIQDTAIASPPCGEPGLPCDVSGNGECTAYDASLILQYFVGKITEFPAGIYYKKSLPSNQAARLALEWGEVEDGIVSLSLNAENCAEVYGSSFELSFDNSALEFMGVNMTGWTQGMTEAVQSTDNTIRFAFAGTESINGSGTIAELQFRMKGGGSDEDLVQLLSAILNEEVVWSSASAIGTPNTYSLDQNYPNPFNPETRIRFSIPEGSQVSITIYNMLGQRVKTLVNDNRTTGTYDIIWDGTNDSGVKLASGVYIYQLKAGSFNQIRKMIFMK